MMSEPAESRATMDKRFPFFLLIILLSVNQCRSPEPGSLYYENPEPLLKMKLIKLPLGVIKPEGWLKKQLQAQADGLTGHLDEFWPDIQHSAWKGGQGDSWERTPYYLDGLVPLAYILKDSALIVKVREFIDPILASQQKNGWFGPGKHWETWPQAITMKVMTSFYEATRDDRVIPFLTAYFRYLHRSPADFPDDDWRGVRAMEHAVTGYWLYRHTADPWILETIQKIFENSSDWTTYYETFPWDNEAVTTGRIPHNWGADGLTAHVVNNGMAFKYPGLYYQQSRDERHKIAVYTALQKYDKEHGQVGGRFSGDEHLSGREPTRGTEMCGVVESMFSLEKLIGIFGDVAFADRLEALTYNALPGTMTPDCWTHQYDQQSNQVLVSVAKRDWSTNGDYSNLYGLMPNYPCCLANMHQAWPKFVEHMWFATPDHGVAALTYGPNTVIARVENWKKVIIEQQTEYPFEGRITLTIKIDQPTIFPIYLRIPGWAAQGQVQVNDESIRTGASGTLMPIKRKWRDGDKVILDLPFEIRLEPRYNKAIAVQRGPLYYALRIEKEYRSIQFKEKSFESIPYKGSKDWEIRPLSPWNFGLALNGEDAANQIQIDRFPIHEFPFGDRGDMVYWKDFDTHVSWQHEAPVVLRVPARRIPTWGMKNNSADDPPVSPVSVDTNIEMVDLVPYGCARLRISEFPLLLE